MVAGDEMTYRRWGGDSIVADLLFLQPSFVSNAEQPLRRQAFTLSVLPRAVPEMPL
jgi:hypothetical protein